MNTSSAQHALPASVFVCQVPLEDGRIMRMQASLRPASPGAAIKCLGQGTDPGWQFALQVQQVLALARFAETAAETAAETTAEAENQSQLLLEYDFAAPEQRQWELAAVLLDRLCRGVWVLPGQAREFVAAGIFQSYVLGQLQQTPCQFEHSILQEHSWVVLACPPSRMPPTSQLIHLQTLSQLEPNSSSAPPSRVCRVHFPLIGAAHCLSWVEVAQIAQTAQASAEVNQQSKPDILVCGQNKSLVWQVEQVLQAARSNESRSVCGWRTAVYFAPGHFVGDSWQLALVLADRISRGRAFAPRARLIASGTSSQWQHGVVEDVAGCQQKTALMLAALETGDRILMPQHWQAELPKDFAQQLQAKGASYALLQTLGQT